MVRQLSSRRKPAAAVRLSMQVVAILIVLSVAGCTAPQQRPPAERPQSPVEAGQPGASGPVPTQTATAALQQDSQMALERGEFARAVALLERAIRIDPNLPELWLDLARVHLKRGSATEAEQFARKALTLTGERHQLEQAAWLVIDDAQRAAQESSR